MCMAYTLKLLNFVHLKNKVDAMNCHLLIPCADHSTPCK